MTFTNIRDAVQPYPRVSTGVLKCPDDSTYFTLQHDPTPVGSYTLVPHTVINGPLHGLQTYALVAPTLGVFHEPSDAEGYTGTYPVRSAILFHPGNYPFDSEGCILVGMTKDTLVPKPSIGQSVVAFKQIIAKIKEPSDLFWVISASARL